MILADRADRNAALGIIYKANKEKVSSYILMNSGSQQEAVDVFQESMIAFYENVRDGKFKGESAISTYLYSIARFKWLNQIKKRDIRTAHHMEAQEKDGFDAGPLASMLDEEKQVQVLAILSSLGPTCKQILIESIYHNASMKEIAANGKFSSEQVVRNKKYICLKKLKALIASKPQLVEILKGHG